MYYLHSSGKLVVSCCRHFTCAAFFLRTAVFNKSVTYHVNHRVDMLVITTNGLLKYVLP